jgi:hypothetical protein
VRKAIVIGTLVFLLILLVRAPANLLLRLQADNQPARLYNVEGTIWSGSGDLLVAGQATGRVSWSFQPVALTTGRLGYAFELLGPDLAVNGEVSSNGGRTTATVDGDVESAFVNQWLSPYDIELSGRFRIDSVTVELSGRQPEATDGMLTWTGGPVRYVLSGKVHGARLPSMRAELGPGPEAVAFAEGQTTPLLHAALKSDGFAKIGVTKYLTRIAGNPWPGGDPDHAVVLVVEEQVF